MDQAKEVELKIHTKNENTLRELENALPGDVQAIRGDSSRSLTVATVLVTATAAVKLVTALLELRRKWRQSADAPVIEVQNTSGDAINLLDASDEMIREFVESA